MSNLSGQISNGSIVLFVGEPPEELVQGDVLSVCDQPADQRAQGYPKARGFMAQSQAFITADMGVSVDELQQ